MARKVLVAHGNTQHLRSAVQALQVAGFHVVATPDGGDAFARFFEEEPDLVICSVALPSLSGPNIARMVVSQAPGTPVVLLGTPEPGEDTEGAVVLPDPLDLEVLRKALPDVVPQRTGRPLSGPVPESATHVFIRSALKRFQRDNNLLALLDEDGLNQLASIAEHQVRGPGERVIAQGDPGDGFYLVVEGQVRVTLKEKGEAEVARISAGGFFGEMAMLNSQPRSASVWTVGSATLLWFERESFMPMLDEYPIIREVLSGVALQRTEENLWAVLFDDDAVRRTIDVISGDPDGAPSEDAPAPVVPGGSGASEVPELGAQIDAELEDLEGLTSQPDDGGMSESTAPDGVDRSGGDEAGVVQAEPVDPTDAVDHVAEDPFAPASSPEAQQNLQPPERPATAPAPVLAGLPSALPRWLPAGLHPQAMIGFGAGLLAGVLGTLMLVSSGPATDHTAAAGRPVLAAAEEPGAPAEASDAAPSLEPLAGEPGDPEDPQGRDEGRGDAPPEEGEDGQPAAEAESPAAPAAPSAGAAATAWSTREASTAAERAERKRMRRRLMQAHKAGKHGEAVRAGRQLAETFAIDWEALLWLADSEAAAGEGARAVASYRRFYESFPTNAFADDARFKAAQVLAASGDAEAARRLYRAVADDPASDLRDRAQAELGE